MQWLTRLLMVKEAERSLFLFYIAVFVFIGVGLSIGRGSVTALFLKRYGVQYLPVMYAALSVFMTAASLTYAAYVDRITSERLFVRMLAVLSVLITFLWGGMSFTSAEWVYPAYYLLFELASELLIIHAKLYMEQNFDGLQLQRLASPMFASVSIGKVLESSLGYFINPLVNVILGLAVLGERLSRRQIWSVLLAALGVAVLTTGLGVLPWISLVLACSFGLYGLLRKTARAGALSGLLVETGLLAPIAVAFLVARGVAGHGALGVVGPMQSGLLLCAGPITAVPLALFTFGARRLPLSTVGLLQYVAPTGQFLLAVGSYGERFSAIHAASFACIWTALGIFTWDFRVRLREAHGAAAALRSPSDR